VLPPWFLHDFERGPEMFSVKVVESAALGGLIKGAGIARNVAVDVARREPELKLFTQDEPLRTRCQELSRKDRRAHREFARIEKEHQQESFPNESFL
jgi:hypothetical protein